MADSKEIKEKWREDDYRQFCKQSCDKIDQGINKLDSWSAKRAIWELFQNARDLAKTNREGEKEAHIKIALTPDEFIFAHQGRPFTHDSFSSLIKQVSSQDKEGEDSVGQYGTGFITTHSFGRKIEVYGSLDLEMSKKQYVNINSFVIDRTYTNKTDFYGKMAHQLRAVENLADKNHVNTCREWTELHYKLNSAENAIIKAKQGIEAAINVMPYVMTINNSIMDVEIIDETENHSISFSKQELPKENGLNVMSIGITCNNKKSPKKVFYLQSEDKQDIIILPLKEIGTAESLEGIAKLFVHFPLLGTEDFGMDFIFHSHRFIPVEERNAIFLPQSENENVRSKYENNVIVLKEMQTMLFQYLEKHSQSIHNWVDITTLKFDCEHSKDNIANNFIRDVKQEWVNFYESLPIVLVENELRKVSSLNVKVFSMSLVDPLEGKQAEFFDDIYNVAQNMGLPNREEILKWSKVLRSWYTPDHSCFLTLDNLADYLSQTNCSLKFNMFAKAIGENYIFENYALIPNREGVLKKYKELRNATSIPQYLYQWSKVLIKDITDSFVDNDFADITYLVDYSMSDLRSDINEFLRNERKEFLDKKTCYKSDILNAIAHLCGIISSEKPNVRKKALPIIWKHLNIQDCWIKIAGDIDIAELPFKHLIENTLLDISLQSAEWVKENYEYVKSIHESLCEWSYYYNNDRKDGYAIKYGAFPNLQYDPCPAKDLMFNKDIPDTLANLYNNICGCNFNEMIVQPDFVNCCEFKAFTSDEVGKSIEEKLKEDNFNNNLVLDIIDNLDNGNWKEEWFKEISAKKAELFFAQAVNGKKKDSIYSLMKIDSPEILKSLVELAGNDDIDEIISRGQQAITEERQKEQDFEYKERLGILVENAINNKLTATASLKQNLNTKDIDIQDFQKGQDLVVSIEGKEVYSIEVKSRWGSDQSVRMSPLQMINAKMKADRYALCCVNMSDIHEEIDSIPDEEIIKRTNVITNIGSLVRGIHVEEENGIYIEDYKCVIPQSVIKTEGQPFEHLIETIISTINRTK